LIEAPPLSRSGGGGVLRGRKKAGQPTPGFQIRFERDYRRQRPRAGPLTRRAFSFGTYPMESIGQNNSEPIPVQVSQHHVGTIVIRFVGLLIVSVAVMALLWSR